MVFKEAEKVLQKAVDIDLQRQTDSFDPMEEMLAVGIMQLHKVYYDSGLAQHPEMKEVLKMNGVTRRLIEALRDARLEDYSAETLNQMYGLN